MEAAEPLECAATIHETLGIRWRIDVVDEEGKPVATGRCALAVRSWPGSE